MALDEVCPKRKKKQKKQQQKNTQHTHTKTHTQKKKINELGKGDLFVDFSRSYPRQY